MLRYFTLGMKRSLLVLCAAVALGVATPSRAGLASTAVRGLEGGYSGMSSRTASFTFGQTFPHVRRAWLHVSFQAVPPHVPTFVSAGGSLDGLWRTTPAVALNGVYELDVRLPSPEPDTVLDGAGQIGLFLNLGCCDHGYVVTAATLWFDYGVPGPDHRKISSLTAGFTGNLDPSDGFGAVAPLGDLDGDGVPDLAVGASGDDAQRGALWILLLNADSTVKAHPKIVGPAGSSFFGYSATRLGDLDGDGVVDVAVGAPLDDDGGFDRGAAWVLLLNADGTVKAQQKISDTAGGFAGALDDSDFFGVAVAGLGDLDGDGAADLAVAAPWDDDGGADRGAVWLLLLHPNGTVKAHHKISATAGGFAGPLDNSDLLGYSIAGLGDVDADGVPDLAAGAFGDDDGGTARGAVWTLLLNANGTVKAHRKISATAGNLGGVLDDGDSFGASVGSLGDFDGDGIQDLVVAATNDDDGDINRGAVWLLTLAGDGAVKEARKVSNTHGRFMGDIDDGNVFGRVSLLGDLDGDGVADLGVGVTGDDDGGQNAGAVWILRIGNGPFVSLRVDPGSLAWSAPVGGTGFDVVRGSLGMLRTSGGDFSTAALECLADDAVSSVPYAVNVASGEGVWFLVRQVTTAGNGTYDSTGPSQVASRDGGIVASGSDCP